MAGMSPTGSFPTASFITYTSGGTTYLQTVVGQFTISGVLSKRTSAIRAGSITLSGSPNKRTSRTLTSSTTPSGFMTTGTAIGMALAGSITLSGALQQAARYLRSYSSILTPSGTLRKMTLKGLSGSLAVAGQLAKGMFLRLTGSITPSGEVSGFKFTPTISNVISTTLRSIRRFIGRR